MKTIIVFLLLWISSTSWANAQFIKFSPDKTVELVIIRPPQSELSVRRVAFGNPSRTCINEAGELLDRMVLPDFQQNQIDVIERQALDQIMAEHNFNQSSYADSGSATQLGKILGPSAMIIVDVNTCRGEQLPLFRDEKALLSNNVVRVFISKTRYTLEGSVRIIDLTTGKILGSHNFESKPEKSNEAQNGQPEYPPVDELKDTAMEAVKFQVHSMFFPYPTPTHLIFYDDKDCDLKQVYDLYKNGDHDGALHLVDQNLQQCKSGGKKDKTLARAYYDAGVLHCLSKDYDAASDLFKSAMDSKGAEAVATASPSCQQAKLAEAQLKAYRERSDQIPTPSPINPTAPVNAAQPPTTQAPPTAQSQSTAGGVNVTATANGTISAEQRLKKLDNLLKQGLITKKEYDEKRTEILKDL